MLEVWGRTNSVNVQKVMWALGELGIEHRRHDAGGSFGKLDTAAYGAMNPNRLVPVIDDDGIHVWESNACVRYLAARYAGGSPQPDLWPDDPGVRARSDMWMDWVTTTVMPDLGPVFWNLIRQAPEQRDAALVVTASKRLGKTMTVLEEALSEHRFIAGSELSIGDIPLGCMLYRYLNLEIERPNLPNVLLYLTALKERDAYRQHVMLPLT